MSAAANCQAVLILTEWDEFKTYDYSKITSVMAQGDAQKTIYDFRQLLARDVLVSSPFERAFQLGVGWLKEGI